MSAKTERRGRPRISDEPMVSLGVSIPASVATVLRAEVNRLRAKCPDTRSGVSISAVGRVALRSYIEHELGPHAIEDARHAIETEKSEQKKTIVVRRRSRPAAAQPGA